MKKFFNFQYFFKHYLSFVLLLLTMQWILRIYEFTTCLNTDYAYSWVDFFTGLGFDLVFIFSLSTLLIPIYFLFYLIRKKLADNLFIFLAFVITLISYGLERYFLTVFYPLGKVFFSYNLHELILIAHTGSGLNTFSFVFPALFIIATVFFFRYFRKREYTVATGYILLFLMLFSTIFGTHIIQTAKKKMPEEIYQKRVNKISYFIRDALSLFDDEEQFPKQKLSTALISTFRSAYPHRKFASIKYPMLYTPDTSSTLYQFFYPSKHLPNLVFVIVESLTRCYSGPNAWAGSYTPFLDSLAQHSLYWTDFVSTSQRTIGVLPGVFGSLPSAKEGFTSLGGKMPKHYTLINILRKNHYKTEFFYGGNPSFDNTNVFLSRQGINVLQSGSYYKKKGVVYWGLSDSLVFAKSLKYHALQQDNHPFLSIYLTLSTHGPFDFERQQETEQFLLNKWSKKLNNKQKEYLKANISKLASYYYTDRQIRNLFYGLKTLGKLHNTIFIVTGDHGVVQVCTENPVQRYHIPLLIYSPLLKRPKTMAAINSHYNITPALLRYLQKQYLIKTPIRVHWMGGDLDTSNVLRSKIPIPIMQLNRSVKEVIDGHYFLSKGKLYQVEKNMKMVEINNDSVQQKLQNWLDAYIKVNQYVCNHDIMVSKSEYTTWGTLYKPLKKSSLGNVKIDSSIYYVPLWTKQTNGKEGNYRVQLSFDLLPNHVDTRKYPYFVLKLATKKDSAIFYKEVEWVREWANFNSQKQNHLLMSVETFIPENLKEGNYKLIAYLWNHDRESLELKNVKIEVFQEIKQHKTR